MKTYIIEACSDLGVNIDGAKFGPKLITSGENFDRVISVVADEIEKNNDSNNLNKNLESVNKFNRNLYDAVRNVISHGYFPLTIGGDHSVAIGSALASIKEHGKEGIIWVDSHGDFNVPETSPSGNIHGYPFAAVCGYHNEHLSTFHNGEYFNPNNAVLVGARDIDIPYELQNFKDAGVTIFTTDDIKHLGVDNVMERAFEIASNGTNGVHVSYDLDAIDPLDAPGVSVRVPNGFNSKIGEQIIDYILNEPTVNSMDLVEFNPKFDIDNKTLEVAKSFVKKINGHH